MLKDPAYCLHKPTGNAFVRLGGKQIYLGKFGSDQSRQRYQQELERWKALGRPLYRTGSEQLPVVIGQLIEAFWNHAQVEFPQEQPAAPGKRPAGELGNYWDVLRPLRRLFGDLPADSFGPREFKALRDYIIHPHEARHPKTGEIKRFPGCCRNVANRRMSRIRAVFHFGVEEGLVSAGTYAVLRGMKPLRAGRGGARETEPVHPVADVWVDQTLRYLSRQVRAMVDLQRATGMRPGEVVRLTTGEIDTTGEIWIYRPARHKTAHHGIKREIYFGNRSQQILERWLRTDLAEPLFSPAEAEAERHEQIKNRRRTDVKECEERERRKPAAPKRRPADSYTPKAYARAIARAAAKADMWAKGGAIVANDQRIVPHWHPNQLRHNFATDTQKALGWDAAAAALGHQKLTTTQRYVEVSRGKLAEEVARKIG